MDNQRLRIRPRDPRTVYHHTADGQLAARSSKHHSLRRSKDDFVYAEDEPTKVLRRVIVDPRTGARETIYEKEKPKRQVQQRYTIQKRTIEVPADLENDYEQQPQYVQVVQRQAAPKQEAPITKYMMIRKKVESEPVYTEPSSPVPATRTVRRVVYETPVKRSQPTFVYANNGKYYK